MNRWTMLLAGILIIGLLALGCSGGNTPLAPDTNPDLTVNAQSSQTQYHLWGYYDVYFDLENQSVEAVPNHSAEFAANVVQFLNKQGGLGFNIIDTPVDPGGTFVDVDIDVSLTHPLSGLPQYDGYDVRGIFVAEGTQGFLYDADLGASNMTDEQYMLDDPTNADGGGADGYTRWWNPDEFTLPGLLGYTPGAVATKGYTGSATLNPYKYFADGLGASDDLWGFLNTTADNGVFTSGSTNTRNYYLRFPTPTPNVKYGYAVVASWKGEAPEDHPANATEAQGVMVEIEPDLYYVDGTENGGDFSADISVFDWGSSVSAGVMEDYIIHVESEVATTLYTADASAMTPVGGTDTYSTYHVEFAADNLTYNSSAAGHDGEYWVIVEYPNADYKYPDDPAVPAPDANLAAFFRFNDLFINDEPYHTDPLCDLVVVTTMPHDGDGKIEFDITGTTYYDGAVFASASWDFNDDGTFGDAYDAGTDENPTKYYTEDYVGQVCVIITDDMGGETECCVDVDITYNPLYSESFDNDMGGWQTAYSQYFSGGSQPTIVWSTNTPYGDSAGALRMPASGTLGTTYGGWKSTACSPPIAVPTGQSAAYIRVHMAGYTNSFYGTYYNAMNWKIGPGSSTVGIAPHNPTGALGAGCSVAMPTTAYGATIGGYTYTGTSHTSGFYGQSWNTVGGGNWPGSLTGQYVDLVVPASLYGQNVRIAFQFLADWPYDWYGGGFAIDDVALVTVP